MSESILISSGGLEAEILKMGASIRALRPAGVDHSVVLGLADEDLYGARNKDYFGATVGRFANRIGAGRTTIDGEDLSLAVNDPPNHLHGGPTGFSTRLFTIEERSEESVTLAYVSEDGEEGYPGRVSMRATFAVSGDTLTIAYEAETDRETVVNLTSHLYFNLDGSGPITDHVLSVSADHYLPIDAGTLPDGRVLPVEGTGFDYRAGRTLQERPHPLDHNFCLAEARSEAPRPAARLSSKKSGVAMELSTTEPGLQVYDGAKLDGTFRGLDGQPIETLGGLALEPQVWPDAPNRPAFPQALLRPGDRYRHLSRYRFTTS